MPDTILFDDAQAYERYMGHWSRLAGDAFLHWLAPTPNLRWLDVGCGNGAFTELLFQRAAPAHVTGLDPSEHQLAYARTRFPSTLAEFHPGDAAQLPFPDDAFDAAVMPLVIFFLPDPSQGVAEMTRVVRPGGAVSAYAWDMTGGGFPYDLLHAEIRATGAHVPSTPSPDASRLETLHALWTAAGLQAVETSQFAVQRTFANFDDYWTTIRGGASVSRTLDAMSPASLDQLQSRLRTLLPTPAPSGAITCTARANAVMGHVPR